ncbi:MAG: tRNA 2-selenouridine(34) synthase MnmH [Chitinophagaceae bacterium]|nr:tRNA 2-selenouridine(34) synthase MnmH [Chitinophagaceae bacterium]
MAITKLSIQDFLDLSKKGHTIIDVRSPGEYKHAHIPGAQSLPLFSDEERKVVGTLYKQESREKAIKAGLDFFGPKMKTMVEEAERITETTAPQDKIILVYCWRGGMRSAGVAWLLDLYGFKVYTLLGGYKKFRNYVLDSFKINFPFRILGGYTGSGKTELLYALREKGETMVDLEGIAKHKGSAFGNIGMPEQPGQEMFENLLSKELLAVQHQPCIWLEDESQRIGLVNLPHDLWNTMRRSPLYFLDIPFDERLKHIVPEYGVLEQEKLLDAIERITQKLGHQNAKLASQFLTEGNVTESFRILLAYYDKFYAKALKGRDGLDKLLQNIICETVCKENAALVLKK